MFRCSQDSWIPSVTVLQYYNFGAELFRIENDLDTEMVIDGGGGKEGKVRLRPDFAGALPSQS